MFWFDLDNSPHVPLFRPVFSELGKAGKDFVVTARDFAQTIDLLKFWNIDFTSIGSHGGRNKIKKILNIISRSGDLKKFCTGKNIDLAVSHGSRSQAIAAWRLNIKSVLMLDYEYTESRIFNMLSTYILIPKYIPDERLRMAGFNLKKVIRYNGFKEELYLSSFVPDPGFRKSLGIPEQAILVVLRPPGMTGNYHDPKSEELLISSLNHFSSFDNTICLIINRGKTEKDFINSKINPGDKIRFLEAPVDGLQLLYAADIAVSGGGTMNREATLLGTKAYSILTAKRPYLDEYLQEKGKLNFVEKTEDILKIPVEKNYKPKNEVFKNNLAAEITQLLLKLQE